MLIKSISLTNFRCHDHYALECKPTTTLILGSNGCGKTSVLEAICILTQGKSFRATDRDIIKRNTDFYRIELEYDNGEKIIATFDGAKKTFHILDKKSTRLPTKHKYPIILFEPHDLNLVSCSPSTRRKYFDRFFSILNPEYATALNKYEKALTQRNKLLKEQNINTTAVFPWNLLLARNALILKNLRGEFLNEINQKYTNVYHSIADQDEVELSYTTEINNLTEEKYLSILEQNFEKDHFLGHTTFGAHHDNIDFIFNQNLADGSASRGETRSLIIALKFIESNLIQEKLNQKPIILLDDVFSELDNDRRAALINNFKNHQVVITSVEKFSKI